MAEDRKPSLDQEEPFSEDDIRYFIREMDQIAGSHNRGLGQVVVRFTLEQIRAIKKFEESSGKLAVRVYWLTWALVGLTVVIALFTILLWLKG